MADQKLTALTEHNAALPDDALAYIVVDPDGTPLDRYITGANIKSGLATTSTSQTLTNKTIDGDDNTISNLAHGAEVDNPTSGVHGVTGSVVGTSDSQTLTNKTISGEDNTISNLAASVITSGTLAHERGGLELDISAITTGDVLAGASAGTIEIVTASGHSDGDVLTLQADGTADWEAPSVTTAGTDGQVQYNNGGSLGGAAGLVYDDSGNVVHLGNGLTAATPSAGTVSGTGGSGTNVAGGNLVVRPGAGTGSGASGSLILQTAPAGSSGSSLNSYVNAVTLSASGLSIDNLPATSVPLSIKAHAAQSGNLFEINTNSGSGGDLFKVESDGDVSLKTGSTVTVTAGHASSKMQFSSGGGIIFSPASGIFTPVSGVDISSLVGITFASGWVGVSAFGSGSSAVMRLGVNSANSHRAELNGSGVFTVGGASSASSPANGTVKGVDASGEDVAGASLTVAAGAATGAGAAGSLKLQAAISDAGTGSTLNGLSTGYELTADTSKLLMAWFGNDPVGQAAHPGTAAGDDADVVNAIVTALVNYGLLQADTGTGT